jgi:hypothetical protein
VPEPDIAVVQGSLVDYRHAHPARPALTIEVAARARNAAPLHPLCARIQHWALTHPRAGRVL